MTATSLGEHKHQEGFASKAGTPPSILFVPLFQSRSVEVSAEPACLPSVGIAIARFPKTLRNALQEFLTLHKVMLAQRIPILSLQYDQIEKLSDPYSSAQRALGHVPVM